MCDYWQGKKMEFHIERRATAGEARLGSSAAIYTSKVLPTCDNLICEHWKGSCPQPHQPKAFQENAPGPAPKELFGLTALAVITPESPASSNIPEEGREAGSKKHVPYPNKPQSADQASGAWLSCPLRMSGALCLRPCSFAYHPFPSHV